MVKWILIEILEVPAERSRGRHNPRAVRSRGKLFPIKPKRSEPADPHPALNYDDCIRIVPPDRLCKIMREAADRRRKSARPDEERPPSQPTKLTGAPMFDPGGPPTCRGSTTPETTTWLKPPSLNGSPSSATSFDMDKATAEMPKVNGIDLVGHLPRNRPFCRQNSTINQRDG
jgi:hypothetical protein